MSPASISPFVLRHFSRTRIFQIPAAVSNQQQEIIKPLEKEKKKLLKMIDRGGGERRFNSLIIFIVTHKQISQDDIVEN